MDDDAGSLSSDLLDVGGNLGPEPELGSGTLEEPSKLSQPTPDGERVEIRWSLTMRLGLGSPGEGSGFLGPI